MDSKATNTITLDGVDSLAHAFNLAEGMREICMALEDSPIGSPVHYTLMHLADEISETLRKVGDEIG